MLGESSASKTLLAVKKTLLYRSQAYRSRHFIHVILGSLAGLIAGLVFLRLVAFREGYLAINNQSSLGLEIQSQKNIEKQLSPVTCKPEREGIFTPDAVSLATVTKRLCSTPNKNLSDLLHTLHLFGPSLQITETGTGEAVSVIDLLLDSDRAGRQFGGSRTLCSTRFGARFFDYQPTLLGTNQEGRQAHPGQAIAILAGCGVSRDRPIRLAGAREGTVEMLLRAFGNNNFMSPQIASR